MHKYLQAKMTILSIQIAIFSICLDDNMAELQLRSLCEKEKCNLCTEFECNVEMLQYQIVHMHTNIQLHYFYIKFLQL